MQELSRNNALAQAFRFIGYREHSRSELLKKLEQKGYKREIIESVLSRLAELGLIDDRSFGKHYIESRTRHRPAGKHKLRADLIRKGIDGELIEELLGEFDSTPACLEAAEKKYRQLRCPEEEKREKIAVFLRNKGFEWQMIQECLHHLPNSDSSQS